MRCNLPILSFSRLRLAALVVASAVFAPATSHAENPQKAAKKVLAKAAAATGKALEVEITLHKKLFFSKVKSLEDKFKAGAGGSPDLAILFNDLVDFQVAVRDQVFVARDAMLVGHGQALTILADASVGKHDRPEGFYYGDGGTLDELRDDVLLTLRKTYDSVEKRLRKTAKVFRKEAQLSLAFKVSVPAVYLEWVVSPGGSGLTYTPVPQTIDVAVAGSSLLVENDGRWLLGGACYTTGGALSLWTADASSGSSSVVGVGEGDRWTHSQTAVSEGNYAFAVGQSSVTAGRGYVSLGIH